MSHASTSTREFDFWEFVNCSRCHLPFAAEAGAPSVPFWLTECGHVICNNHLNADQSCAQCEERGIQLMPLQQDMELPMSDWFRSAPSALDSIAFSTRFQMDTLASLVRHYKKKYSHQRLILERLKGEYKNLKRYHPTVEDLQAENEQIRRYAEYGQGTSSDIRNDNGKRRMLDSHYSHPDGARNSSSPRSIVTPVGPDRLTLPPDHQQPTFTSRRASHSDDPSQAFQDQSGRQQRDRPGSRRFAQYAPC
ncbi:uncharacterized protein LAESUDRAFT_734218 [Laetiporus sulphureus 93-53]|uniref:RING-type domain-containing protein n=1 Tax=Laetiporus sulphureus 93-53 TaxID=1314785 RepID=A0A165H7F3_9APHY|nr:uncharacterized protein LAESUDRAFT_734218 [Laetiporus sulphureus 93-53]KZT11348.1 hypothetical protein LAESUDRAFT_734218 [Laetiporus sulphureus 93-53]